MVHRYIVGALGLLVIGLAVFSVLNRRDPAQPRVMPWLLVALLVVQALLGMWTVTLLLKPLIVTLHLLGGLSTLALLAWLALPPARRELKASERPIRRLAIAGLMVLIVQVSLGGWTSTNYAAAACPDFPTCQGTFWPPMDFRNAFILWRGLGIDYEGGVLDAPARVAIHYTHRLGAVVTTIVLALVVVGALRRGQSNAAKLAGIAVAIALLLQLADRDEPGLEGVAAVARHGPQRGSGAARADDRRAPAGAQPALGDRPLSAWFALSVRTAGGVPETRRRRAPGRPRSRND